MPYAALHELLALSGLEAPRCSVAIGGGADPVFPSRFRIAIAGAAALAAVGVAAARLWELRTGRRQAVAVDFRAAAAAMRSSHYLRVNGEPRGDRDPVMGYYRTADGWIFIHSNYPGHRAAALKVLGAPAEPEAVARAAARWDGLALEEAIHAAGGCANRVRSAAEWSAHPQAAAVAALPVIDISRIGDAPPEPLQAGDRPLAGIRVLDLTRVLAGPTCAKTLAEHGADVLKISAPHLPYNGDVEFDTGIGKRSAYVDLRDKAHAERLRALVREGDVFSQSYRPGALAGRGFGPEQLAAMRPGIVCVSLSAWGHDGPWQNRRGYDTIVQSTTGWAELQGELMEDGRTPRLQPVSAIDYVSGYVMALGVMAALARRAQEGGSWLVRVALARSGQWIADRGLVDIDAARAAPAELEAEEIARLTAEIVAPVGRVRHLKPIVQLSETPGYWAHPPVPLGHDEPRWPARPT